MTVKRLNYFKGQFLKAVDFTEEQGYHMEMLRRHNSDLHTWGIAKGLDVDSIIGSSTATVSEGMAVDKKGRQIVLSGGSDVDFSTSAAGDYYLVISYNEDESNHTDETGVEGYTRMTETPVIETPGVAPGETSEAILLARVAVDADHKVVSVDKSNRKYAGVVAADMTAKSLSFSIDNMIDDKWPRLSGADVNSKGRLNVTAEETSFSGDLGIGTAPLDALDVNGDIRLRGADIKDAGGTARITITDNGRLDLKEDNGVESLSINTGGNVGIGTTAVTAGMKLDVNGALRVRTNLTVNGDITLGGSDILDAGGTSRITIADNGRLDLKEDGGAESLSIDTNGNIGIGTTAVTAGMKLDVNGALMVRSNLSLSGTITGATTIEASGQISSPSLSVDDYAGIGGVNSSYRLYIGRPEANAYNYGAYVSMQGLEGNGNNYPLQVFAQKGLNNYGLRVYAERDSTIAAYSGTNYGVQSYARYGQQNRAYYGMADGKNDNGGYSYGGMFYGRYSQTGNYGVYGVANGSGGVGTTYGGYFTASGGETNYAGYFSGDLYVTGKIIQQGWIAANLVYSWVNYGGGYNPAGYFLDKNGIVHLRGLVKNGTSGYIFNLPAAYRPANQELQVTITYSNASCRIDIRTDGWVTVSSYNNAWVSLDGISFRSSGS